jgi:amino acid transporter
MDVSCSRLSVAVLRFSSRQRRRELTRRRYWFKYIIVTPNQLTAAALVIQYWVPRERINPGVFIAIFLVVICAINYIGVRFFGEFEFWLSSFKVVTIVGVIILMFVLALGGGPDHDRKGFTYWQNPG